MTEEAIETVADICSDELVSINYTKIVVPCVVLIGAAVGAYFLYKKFKKDGEVGSSSNEIAYTYEEALAKAKAKKESVKLSKDQDKPDLKPYSTKSSILDEAIDKESQLKYTKTVEDLGYSKEKIEEEKEEPEETLSFEPFEDEKVGMWYRIAEDRYKYNNPFYEKREFVYYTKDMKLEEISTSELYDDNELERRMATLCSEEDHQDVYFFTNDEDCIDCKVFVEDDYSVPTEES